MVQVVLLNIRSRHLLHISSKECFILTLASHPATPTLFTTEHIFILLRLWIQCQCNSWDWDEWLAVIGIHQMLQLWFCEGGNLDFSLNVGNTHSLRQIALRNAFKLFTSIMSDVQCKHCPILWELKTYIGSSQRLCGNMDSVDTLLGFYVSTAHNKWCWLVNTRNSGLRPYLLSEWFLNIFTDLSHQIPQGNCLTYFPMSVCSIPELLQVCLNVSCAWHGHHHPLQASIIIFLNI